MGTRLSIARAILCALLCLLLSHDLASQTVGTVTLTASDGARGDAFGRSVAMSGDTLIVGAPGNNQHGEGAGAAYSLRAGCCRALDPTPEAAFVVAPCPRPLVGRWRSTVTSRWLALQVTSVLQQRPQFPEPRTCSFAPTARGWSRNGCSPEGLVPGDAFGWAVAVSGNGLLVSAAYRDFFAREDAGFVWGYQRAGSGWNARPPSRICRSRDTWASRWRWMTTASSSARRRGAIRVHRKPPPRVPLRAADNRMDRGDRTDCTARRSRGCGASAEHRLDGSGC